MNITRFTAPLWDLGAVVVFDDFVLDQQDTSAIDTITDSGTVLMGDAVNGVATLTPSDGSVGDNDEAYLASPNEVFKFGTNRSIYGRFKFRYTEVTSDKVNWCVGFQDAVGANSLVDDGAGPKVSGSTLAIAKVDGGSNLLKVYSACNGTSTSTTTNFTVAAATDYLAEIICNDWDGVSMQVSFRFGIVANGLEYLKDANGNIIRHTVLIASATEMQIFAGVKLGAATNNDTLLLDYWYGAQTRV